MIVILTVLLVAAGSALWTEWHFLEVRKVLELAKCPRVLIEHSNAYRTSNELVILLMCSFFRRSQFYIDRISVDKRYDPNSWTDLVCLLDQCFERLPANIHVWRGQPVGVPNVQRLAVSDLWFLYRMFYVLMMLRSSVLSRQADQFVIPPPKTPDSCLEMQRLFRREGM